MRILGGMGHPTEYLELLHSGARLIWSLAQKCLYNGVQKWYSSKCFYRKSLCGHWTPLGVLFLRSFENQLCGSKYFLSNTTQTVKPGYGLERGVWVSFIDLCGQKIWKQSTCIFCCLWDRKYDHCIAMKSLCYNLESALQLFILVVQ